MKQLLVNVSLMKQSYPEKNISVSFQGNSSPWSITQLNFRYMTYLSLDDKILIWESLSGQISYFSILD